MGNLGGAPVVDETGFLKKGRRSVCVARRYSGIAGRIESGQFGVFLGDAPRCGRALVGRALHLPKEWAEDAGRRMAAGVPGSDRSARTIVSARRMVERVLDAGVQATRVTGDAVYGSDYGSRRAAEIRGLGVRTDQSV